ncbi:cellulose biosynthesis protein BcsF [Pseudomonas mohnii]|jgi:cellulose biosynthesis operon protein BcsF/YhjT|uniref:cellulose biosynthesis protein BcsF n=1 Tax=Pseudomonas sp. TaxID=306 RepID=UPI002585166B|nr:cellulose biosynthesis protein BcsF [Pseudomonas sp.]
MNYAQLLQVIAASCLMTVAFMLALRSLLQRFNRLLQQYLSPRYLQPRGVRRRKSVSPVESDAHE